MANVNMALGFVMHVLADHLLLWNSNVRMGGVGMACILAVHIMKLLCFQVFRYRSCK